MYTILPFHSKIRIRSDIYQYFTILKSSAKMRTLLNDIQYEKDKFDKSCACDDTKSQLHWNIYCIQ